MSSPRPRLNFRKSLWMFGLLLLAACSEQGASHLPLDMSAPNQQNTASQRTLKLRVNESATLTVNSTQVKNPKSVKWASSHPAVATVRSDGLVTGIDDGDALIIASSGNLRDTTWVTVIDDAPTTVSHSVQIAPEVVVLEWIGAKAALGAVVRDGAGNIVAAPQLLWHSLNPSVAEVDAMGAVIAKTVGTALIAVTVACCDAADTVGVHIFQRITAVKVQAPVSAVQRGDSVQLTAVAADHGGTGVPDAGFMWSTSNPAVAIVSPTGLVKSQMAGDVYIRAESGGQRDSMRITIVEPPPQPPTVTPPATTNTLELSLHRLDGGSGTVRVSSGIILLPGQLHPSGVGTVAVSVGGVEVPAYVEALHGRHKDGSVVSVLIQFDANPAQQPAAALHLNTAPTTTRLAKQVVDFRVGVSSDVRQRGFPAAVAVPGNDHTVAAAHVFGPTISVAAARNLGGAFAAFENDFEQWSTTKWNQYDAGKVIGVNYYDRGFHHMVWFLRSGDPKYLLRGAAYTLNHRVAYYEPNAYNIAQERMWFPDGLAAHYWLTGDEESRNGVRGLARRVESPGSSWNWSRMFTCSYQGEARPVARGLNVLGWAHRLGHVDRDFRALTTEFLDLVLQGGARQELLNSDPNDYRFGAWVFRHPDYPSGAGCSVEYVSNFMNAMIMDALVLTYEHVHADPRIPGTVKRNLDYLRKTQWRGREGNGLQIVNGEASPSFNYYDVSLSGSGGVGPSVDLNGFYAHLFGWYADRFGGAEYSNVARMVFETLSKNPKDGKAAPWLSGDKQFNETYQKAWQLGAFER
jgi:hypothetical protein